MGFGEKIAELRKKHNMTQYDLGQAMNVSYQAVSKWEREESQPDFETISRIAKLFNVPLGFFEEGGTAEETYSPNPAAPAAKTLIGTCTQCGRVVYEGEEGETQPRLLCRACSEQRIQAELYSKQAAEANRKRKEQKTLDEVIGKGWDVKLIISILAAVAFYALFTVLCFLNNNDDLFLFGLLLFIVPLAAFGCMQAVFGIIADWRDKDDDGGYKISVSMIAGGILAALNLTLFLIIYFVLDDNFYFILLLAVGAVLAFTFVSQYLWGGTVGDIFTCGGFTFKLPGFIFSLTPESIILMIVLKIFLGIIAGIIFILTTILFAVVAIVGSFFLFIPSLFFKLAVLKKAKNQYQTNTAQ